MLSCLLLLIWSVLYIISRTLEKIGGRRRKYADAVGYVLGGIGLFGKRQCGRADH